MKSKLAHFAPSASTIDIIALYLNQNYLRWYFMWVLVHDSYGVRVSAQRERNISVKRKNSRAKNEMMANDSANLVRSSFRRDIERFQSIALNSIGTFCVVVAVHILNSRIVHEIWSGFLPFLSSTEWICALKPKHIWSSAKNVCLLHSHSQQ